ncbi:hypothetical protein [Celerinatantimonas yamalensis]|uniref:Uncharacterized protein n=1 Tax=Celerinatantimonas yamalensis TaxID=559956 RepID=A0ABW9G5J9_9GAMM
MESGKTNPFYPRTLGIHPPFPASATLVVKLTMLPTSAALLPGYEERVV